MFSHSFQGEMEHRIGEERKQSKKAKKQAKRHINNRLEKQKREERVLRRMIEKDDEEAQLDEVFQKSTLH